MKEVLTQYICETDQKKKSCFLPQRYRTYMLYPSRSCDSHSLIQHKPKDIHSWLREQAIFLLAPGSAPLGTEPPAAALQELVGDPSGCAQLLSDPVA